MMNFCLRAEIEKRLPTNDNFTISLILACCDYCTKVREEKEIDKYTKLFIEPICISFKKYDAILLRAMGSAILENTATLFEPSNNERDEMQLIISAVERSISVNNKYLISCLSHISPGAYLKLMARWHFYEADNAVFATALCYLAAKVAIHYMAFRIKFIHREDNQVFFNIGTSLDEGATEYLTLEIMRHSYGETEFLRDAYYFEVESFKNILKQFNIEKENEFAIFFNNKGPMLIYEHTKNADKCSFYKLFHLSDHQDWRSFYQILKDSKGATSNGNDT